ncbi:hypothetical protein [Chloracidobacterium aggregatum]|jgi:hypothetical protein|uniref:hypothetical protein n=1 Tax=Chloracidobacterium aggregatum TaxID=2851959 RepID=UPI001B8AAF34|nr:hypothetical protein [Chloracidobacterium aggregatum]QUV85147.1 hypothetical protein J8C03_02370 [Chloracidobacterium sp. 2]QUV91374.1 hypothetical protein J8C04_02910 [Chloracidobacterium sp. A]QUV97753.1 hypothetical protein J8C00_04720 [Chloracidobacterium sp. E]
MLDIWVRQGTQVPDRDTTALFVLSGKIRNTRSFRATGITVNTESMVNLVNMGLPAVPLVLHEQSIVAVTAYPTIRISSFATTFPLMAVGRGSFSV